eukprot:SAG31_NODE_930_length_10920_cov_4.478329_1_plen_57_part_00
MVQKVELEAVDPRGSALEDELEDGLSRSGCDAVVGLATVVSLGNASCCGAVDNGLS